MKKLLLRNVFLVFVSAGIISVGLFLINGIPLWGLPKPGELSSAEVTDLRNGLGPRTLTGTGELEKTVQVANFLKHSLGMPEPGEPDFEILYHKKDGSTQILSVNEQTVWWQGKAYPLKEESGSAFLNLAQGLFFFEELAGEASS